MEKLAPEFLPLMFMLKLALIENSEKNLTVSFKEKSTPTGLSELNGS